MPFFAVQTTSGQENRAADDIAGQEHDFVDAVLVPRGMNAYLIVEAPEEGVVRQVISGVHGANKVLPGKMSFTEVKSFLAPGSRIEGVDKGDVVEVTGGPYEGSRARVQSINHDKEQLTVELHEEPIPIPVSINGDQFRVAE